MKTKLMAAVLCLLMSSVVMAARDSRIDFPDGQTTPQQPIYTTELTGPSGLVSGITYDIHCNLQDITNPKSTTTTLAALTAGNTAPRAITQNGKFVGGQQFTLLPGANQMVFQGIKNEYLKLNIVSADKQDTVSITNCYAVASGN